MSLHVERRGAGPDLVLLHGWAMHGGAWDEASAALARSFTVHAVDLPGHGRSSTQVVRDFDAAVDAVADVVPEGALVCGWSLGGLVAQRLASRRPGRARALALVAATPCFAERRDWPHGMATATLEDFARGLEADAAGTLARFVRLNALGGATSREAIRAFTQRLQAHGAPSLDGLRASLAWLRDVDLRADAARLSMPLLVLHGGRDRITPVGAARWLAGRVPGARLVELDDAAHLPFFTHRDAFVAALETLHG